MNNPLNCSCGLPLSVNPHPDAGKPESLLAVGPKSVCIPCTVNSRHQWARRATAAEAQLGQSRAVAPYEEPTI